MLKSKPWLKPRMVLRGYFCFQSLSIYSIYDSMHMQQWAISRIVLFIVVVLDSAGIVADGVSLHALSLLCALAERNR